MCSQSFTADLDLFLSQRGKWTLGIAIRHHTEKFLGFFCDALVAVDGPHLFEVAHATIIFGKRQVSTGGVGTLEVAERCHRFRVLFGEVVRISDFELGLLGVGVQGVLVQQVTVLVRGSGEVFMAESFVRLGVIFLGREAFFACCTAPQEQEDRPTHEQKDSSWHVSQR